MEFNKVKKRVLFIRADGGAGIGLGHIMRMLVLAGELKEKYKVYFVCISKSEYKAGIEKIKQNGFDVIEISEDNMIFDIECSQKKYNADCLITDSYSVDEEYFELTRKYFDVTGYIDDLNVFRMNVDFVINQNINAERLKYDVHKDTKLFLGTEFCMMRAEFRKAYKLKRVNDKISNVLVTVGGMDDTGLSIEVLKLLEGFDFNIHVVVGAAFSENVKTGLKKIAIDYTNVFLYENAVMSDLMLKCDAAVSACGSTLYELCAMNVPSIGIIVADNQEEAASNMKKSGAVFEIVHKSEISKIVSLLDCLNKDAELVEEIVNNQKDIVNVNGAELLAHNIEEIIESRCASGKVSN